MTDADDGSPPVATANAKDFRHLPRLLTQGDVLPSWFSCGLYAAVIWCTAAGVTALTMLSKTTYSPIVCVVVATAAVAGAWPFRPRTSKSERAAHGPALAALAIGLVLLAMAGIWHSQHVLTDRDPAVYINVGRSIARTHRVHPTVKASPFDDFRSFSTHAAGFQVARHMLFSNFLDFLPALLALGWSAGGDTGLLLVPAILGALGLLALYALASTVVGPRWALLGPALLTLAPLQSWFARDAYAELPLEVLALGGIWLLIEARRGGGWVAGAIAGVILGSITFVRIDALAILIAIPAALAVDSLRTEGLEPAALRRRRAAFGSFMIALIVAAASGLFVSHRLTPGYVTNLQHNLRLLELAFCAGIVGGLAILLVHAVHGGIGHRLARNKILLSAAATVTVVAAAYAWIWRPRTGAPPVNPAATLSPAARKTLDAFYFSSSFRWFGWYLGVFTLILVVIGAIVLGLRAAHSDSATLVLLAAAVPVTLLYIARPSVSPDHLWAMRRYLPIVLPAMTIAAAAAAICATTAIGKWQPRLRAPVVVVFVGAMLIPAAIAGRPFIRAETQGGALTAVHDLCHAAGTNAAIAVEPYGLLGAELPQTLRGFCGVPAAAVKEKPLYPLSTYATEWKSFGRTLYVISAAQAPVLAAAANAVEIAHVVVADTRDPEHTLGRRPRIYAPKRLEVWLYRVDAT